MGDEVRPDSESGLNDSPEPPDHTLRWVIVGIIVFAVCGLTYVAVALGLYSVGRRAEPTTPQPTDYPTPDATQQIELNKLAGPPEGWERTGLQFGRDSQWHTDAMPAPYGGKMDIFFNDAADYVWDMRPGDYSMSAARTSTIGGEYRDFYIAVDVVVEKGDPADLVYGLLFRQSYNSYYRFGLSEQRGFFTDMRANGDVTNFGGYASDAINPTIANHLAVLSKGSQFWLFINGQYVGGFERSTLPQGGVGIFATCWDSAEQCVYQFSNFEAYKPK